MDTPTSTITYKCGVTLLATREECGFEVRVETRHLRHAVEEIERLRAQHYGDVDHEGVHRGDN